MKARLAGGIAIGVAATLVVAVAVWLGVAYTGAYSVAATDRHADIVRWTLDTTMRSSVASRAGDLVPPEVVSAESVEAGARAYASACAHCHGAPGSDPAPWSRNMRPMPPELVEAAAHWEPAEVYWIVRNGIRMSGMPAFGPEHGEDRLWGIAAFVKRLPAMTPDDYRAVTEGAVTGGAVTGGAGAPDGAGGAADRN